MTLCDSYSPPIHHTLDWSRPTDTIVVIWYQTQSGWSGSLNWCIRFHDSFRGSYRPSHCTLVVTAQYSLPSCHLPHIYLLHPLLSDTFTISLLHATISCECFVYVDLLHMLNECPKIMDCEIFFFLCSRLFLSLPRHAIVVMLPAWPLTVRGCPCFGQCGETASGGHRQRGISS